MVRLAVRAHVCHAETDYDQLLAKGYDRGEVHAAVEMVIARVLFDWEG